MSATAFKASVIVCTRNRSSSLAEACEAILAIDFPADRWEMVIVDNRSDDDTLEVARSIESTHPELVRVIREPRIGLSAARNAGVRTARGEIIAFIDDDAFPEPAWLQALVGVLDRDEALAAGGPVEPLFQGELPDWFGEPYLPYLTVWDKGPEVQPLTYNEYPRGANVAFHRVVFERFGFFSTHLGRKGRSLLSCEELELCLRIERSGGKILYVPGAKIRHLTVAERVTTEWLVRRFAAQGRSEAVIDWRHAGLRGLRVGLRRYRGNAATANRQRHSEAGEIFARCQRSALRGYWRGLLSAPMTVPRYRAPAAAGPVAEWLPFT